MRRIWKVCGILTMLLPAMLASPAIAQAPMPAPPGITGVNTGLLSCNLSPTIGLVIGSLQTMNCVYKPIGPYPPEHYTGTFGTLGLDVGITLAQGLAWQVYAPTAGPLNGALAGAYVGPSGEIGVGVGVGANILFGGNARAYALQQWATTGQMLVMNVDPRIPQPSEVGDLVRGAYLGQPSNYAIKDGKIVTSFGNREYEISVYRLGGGSTDLLKADEKYIAARSNEFGYANYEIIPTPVFLGTEVKGEVPK